MDISIREQLNQITHWLDGTNIYGSTTTEAMHLRYNPTNIALCFWYLIKSDLNSVRYRTRVTKSRYQKNPTMLFGHPV